MTLSYPGTGYRLDTTTLKEKILGDDRGPLTTRSRRGGCAGSVLGLPEHAPNFAPTSGGSRPRSLRSLDSVPLLAAAREQKATPTRE